MGLFRKKPDPISDRSKALNAQIASLEAQIKKLDSKLQQTPAPSNSQAHPAAGNGSAVRKGRTGREPVFEPVDLKPLDPHAQPAATPAHFNDLGVRKYDLAAHWQRLRQQFRGPPANNPKLVTYLAAGSIKGLRPLRYEKRVARNRFVALFVVLVFLVWGIIAVFLRSH
jgi:hypothetical protein